MKISKNIKKIINKSKKYTLEDKLICEEFVSGKEINVVILVEKSKIKILSLSEEKLILARRDLVWLMLTSILQILKK